MGVQREGFHLHHRAMKHPLTSSSYSADWSGGGGGGASLVVDLDDFFVVAVAGFAAFAVAGFALGAVEGFAVVPEAVLWLPKLPTDERRDSAVSLDCDAGRGAAEAPAEGDVTDCFDSARRRGAVSGAAAAETAAGAAAGASVGAFEARLTLRGVLPPEGAAAAILGSVTCPTLSGGASASC